MSKEARLERIRTRLAKEVDETDWEWNFVSGIVIIAREMGIDTDEIMEWSIMKYDVVCKAIAEFYAKQTEVQPTTSDITLGK